MVNDSNIITINSTESKMKINKFSGNHKQETREGYNIFDYLNHIRASISGLTTTTDKEGYIIVNGTPTAGYANIVVPIDITDLLEDNTTYTLWQDSYSDTKYGGVYLQCNIKKKSDSSTTYLDASKQKTMFTVNKSQYTYTANLQIGTTAVAGTFNNYKNRYMIYKGTDNKTFELYGASPSIIYPSEIEAVGDNINIFDGEIEEGGYDVNGEKVAAGNTVRNKNFIDIGNYKTVIFSNDGNGIAVNIYEYDKDYTFIKYTNAHASNKTFNKTSTTKYINFSRGNTNVDKIKIEPGEIITSYSPYGQGSVEVKKINKNWAKIDTPHTVERSGLNIEVDNEGVFTLNGTTTANMYINLLDISEYQNTTLSSYKIPVKKYKAYFELISKNNSDGSVFLNVRNFAASSVGEQATTYCAFDNLIAEDVGIQIKDCNITKDRVVAYLYIASGAKLDDFKFKFALYNEDETDTTYEKHQEQSLVLDIQKPMLSGDYFIKEADGWKEVHAKGYVNSKKVPNLSVALNTSNGDFRRYSVNLNVTDRKAGEYIAGTLCTHFKYADSRWHEYEGICGWETGQSFCIGTFNTDCDTADKMKTFLQQNDVEIYYPLATPTKLACTSEQITVLNELQNILLYDDTTHIMLDDVYPILDYDVSKIVDTTMTFEASLDENGYFVVPDYNIKCLVSYSESNIPTMPEAVESTVRIAGKDGDVVLGTTYEPIAFTIVCYTDDNLSVEEKNAEELKMNNFLNSIKDKTIRLKNDSKNIFYNVKYNGLLTTINYPKHLQFSIPLKTSASFANNIEKSYMLGNATKQSNTAKKVGAIFTIAGPAQTPKIYLNDYEMFYNNVILSGAKLIIDSNRSTVTMVGRDGNLTNAMRYYNHEFPKIENGENVLKVSSGIDEDRQVSVEWFDLKL